jgi:hypothetical protein
MSSFMHYTKDMHAHFKEEKNEATFSELGKLISEQWKALSVEEKKPYQERAAESKKYAKQALAEYREKEGERMAEQDTSASPRATDSQPQSDALMSTISTAETFPEHEWSASPIAATHLSAGAAETALDKTALSEPAEPRKKRKYTKSAKQMAKEADLVARNHEKQAVDRGASEVEKELKKAKRLDARNASNAAEQAEKDAAYQTYIDHVKNTPSSFSSSSSSSSSSSAAASLSSASSPSSFSPASDATTSVPSTFNPNQFAAIAAAGNAAGIAAAELPSDDNPKDPDNVQDIN